MLLLLYIARDPCPRILHYATILSILKPHFIFSFCSTNKESTYRNVQGNAVNDYCVRILHDQLSLFGFFTLCLKIAPT